MQKRYKVAERLMKIPLRDEDGILYHSIPFVLDKRIYEEHIEFIREVDSELDRYEDTCQELKTFFVRIPYNIELVLEDIRDEEDLMSVVLFGSDDKLLKQLNHFPLYVSKSFFVEINTSED